MSKAFFFDIDGTLLDTPRGIIEISAVNQAAILKVLENHLAFIATGRTKCFIVEPIRNFPFSGFITCNGAYVEYQNQCIFKRSIEVEALKALKSVCDLYQFDYYIEGYNTIYVNDVQKPSVVEFAEKWEMSFATMNDQFDVNSIEAHIAMVKVNNEEECAIIYDKLNMYFDITRHPKQLSFDLNIKGINKGVGIEALIKSLKMDIQNTYAFGDGYNDLEMLSVVGHGIAMGNAVEPLKEIAETITDEVQNDGVAKALKIYNF